MNMDDEHFSALDIDLTLIRPPRVKSDFLFNVKLLGT